MTKLPMILLAASTPAVAQSITVECAAFTSGGVTDTSGDALVLGQAFVGTTSGPGIDLDAGLLACLVDGCRADLDADGELTIFDFLAFQNAFDAMDPVADFDGDGAFTIFDFLAFQNAFDVGC